MNRQNDLDRLIGDINSNNPSSRLNIMEVCGTHTMAISRHGLRQLLPENINLISGPGCPVCVTSARDIDHIIKIIHKYDVSVYSFGDMFRVPGSDSSLYLEKSKGKDIKICYSPADSLDFARANPDKKVIFIAIGFETTIPLISVIIKRAYEENINNFYIYNAHKLVPQALELLLQDEEVEVDGFLCPGHVSAIIGCKPYRFIAEDYHAACVISGFEPFDILESIAMLAKQVKDNKPEVLNQYTRVVREEGNPAAVKSIYDVFDISDSLWRGIGNIPGSGLMLKEKFLKFDAKANFEIEEFISKEPAGCQCGNVLKGIKKPFECKLFSKVCRPENPIGPCMVSSEGSCAAYFKYERSRA